MNLPTIDDLQTLMAYQERLCVSIFLPTHEVGPEGREAARIRLKNAIDEAERALAPLLTPPDVRNFVKPAADLLELGGLYAEDAQGVAIFLTDDVMLMRKIDPPEDTDVVIARRFVLRPLLGHLSQNRRFMVLAVSANAIRLLACSPHNCGDITPNDVPQGMDVALRFDDPEEQLQMHTSRPTIGAPGPHAAIYHGQGVPEDDAREQRYIDAVLEPLQPMLANAGVPVVLAGVERWFPYIRAAADTEINWIGEVAGSQDRTSNHALHAAAWQQIKPYFEAEQRKAWERYKAAAGNANVGTADDLHDVVRAAYYGHVDTLYLPKGNRRWGIYDEEGDEMLEVDDPMEGAGDLIDLAAAYTLLNGGGLAFAPDIANLEQPAAILRFRQAEEVQT